MAKFKVGDWVEHQNFLDLGKGKIIFVSRFKKYTILFKTCFLKHCTEKYIWREAPNSLRWRFAPNEPAATEETIAYSQSYINYATAEVANESAFKPTGVETVRFYENMSDMHSLDKIWRDANSEEYKFYSNLLGSTDLESGVIDLKNEILKDIQEQIIGRKFNPNVLVNTAEPYTAKPYPSTRSVDPSTRSVDDKSIIQLFFELLTPSMPLHIELQILRYLLEYSGGSDTIPPFKNGPCIFKCIVKKFHGVGLSMALNILLDSGMEVEKTIWEIMNASVLPNPSFDKDFRNYIIDILCEHLPTRNECSICFENIGYRLSCCMRPDNANFVCHECYINTTSCPFCRDPLGMLMNPSHERLISHIFNV